MKDKANREIGLGSAIVVFAALGFLLAIPYGIVMPGNIEVLALAPNFWPFVVMAMAGIAGAVITAQGFLDRTKPDVPHVSATPDEATPVFEEIDDDRPPAEAAMRATIVVGSLFALYFAIPFAGIVAGTMVILIFLIWLSGERRWRLILSIAILLPLVLYFFFVHVANVPMPVGVFETFR